MKNLKEQFIVINQNFLYSHKYKIKKSEIQVYLALYFLRFEKFPSKSLKINRVGEYTGLNPFTVYRAIRTLQREGLIKIEGEMIYYLGIDDVEWNKDFIKIQKSIIDKLIKDPTRLIVFLLIALKKGNITVREIMIIGQLSKRSVLRAINELESEGIIVVKRVGKRNYYSIPMLYNSQDQNQDKSKTFAQFKNFVKEKRNGKVIQIGEVLNDLIDQKRNGQNQIGEEKRIDGQNGQSQNQHFENDKQNGQSRLRFPSSTASLLYEVLPILGEFTYDKIKEEAISIMLPLSERDDPEKVKKVIQEVDEALRFFEIHGIIEKTETGYRIAKKAWV